MQTSVTFKNIDPSDHLKAYVRDKLDRFDRFLDNPAEANVVLSVEKFRHIAEIKHHRRPVEDQRQGRDQRHVFGHRYGPG